MKVLILANFDVGLYQFRRELIGALLENHAVTLSLPDGDLVRPLEEMGCRFIDTPVDRRGINPVKDLGLLVRYWKLLRQEKPDLVITYTIKPNIYGGLVSRMLRIPYAVNITGLGTAFQNPGLLRSLVTFLYKIASGCRLRPWSMWEIMRLKTSMLPDNWGCDGYSSETTMGSIQKGLCQSRWKYLLWKN